MGQYRIHLDRIGEEAWNLRIATCGRHARVALGRLPLSLLGMPHGGTVPELFQKVRRGDAPGEVFRQARVGG